MSILRRRWSALAALALCLLAGALIPVTVPIEDNFATPLPVTTPGTANAARPVGAIMAGRDATQQFPARGTRIRSIALLLATYGRTNRGTAEVIVEADTDGRWQTLASRTIAKGTLVDDAYHTITFTPQLAVARGQPVRITLRSDGGPNDAITWWTNASWQADGYSLTYGGRPQEGSASFQVGYAAISGPLITSLGPLWHRLTVFLGPLWQAALLMSLGVVVSGAIALGWRNMR